MRSFQNLAPPTELFKHRCAGAEQMLRVGKKDAAAHVNRRRRTTSESGAIIHKKTLSPAGQLAFGSAASSTFVTPVSRNEQTLAATSFERS